MRPTSLRSSLATMPRQPLCIGLHVHNKIFTKRLKTITVFFNFHFTIQGSTGLTPHKTTFLHFFSLSLFCLSPLRTVYLLFCLSPLLSISSSFYLLTTYRLIPSRRSLSPLFTFDLEKVHSGDPYPECSYYYSWILFWAVKVLYFKFQVVNQNLLSMER